MARIAPAELEAGLQSLFGSIVNEALPASFANILAQMEEVEPSAMGGNALGSLPFAGGEVAGGITPTATHRSESREK